MKPFPRVSFLLLVAIDSHDFQEALAESNRSAESVLETQRALKMSLVYPAIVIGLAYLGLVSMCLFFVPVLEDLYENMQLPTGKGLNILLFLRVSLPYWIAVPPVLALLFLLVRIVMWRRTPWPAMGRLAWLPGMRRVLFLDACATFSDSLAKLVENGTPFPAALAIAAEASGTPSLEAQAAEVALWMQRGTPTSDDNRVARQVPPFLRWALLHGGQGSGQPQALRAAARVYRETAQRRLERIRLAVPLVACVLIAGSVTLLYGLALFSSHGGITPRIGVKGMATFHYEAIDQNGQRHSGALEADTASTAVMRLEQEGYTVLSVTQSALHRS